MFDDQSVLGDEVVVCHVQGFWEACGSGREEASGCGGFAGSFIVEAFPVGFAVIFEPGPGFKAMGDW
jgi:hypothetical protein